MPIGGVLKVVGNLLGIGKDYLNNKQKLKQAKADQEFKIIQAETDAVVNRINKNTQSDSEIDIITARNKRFTSKDEIVTYLFLLPVLIANVMPFIMAFNGDWRKLNSYFIESYEALNLLPSWYPYIVGLIIVDVLGFRSFARKFIESKINKTN